MGSGTDYADLERFERSNLGKAYLDEIRAILFGRTICDVQFHNETHFIATILHLDNGKTFVVFQPSLEVGAIREQFAEALEEEYYKDFPERRPGVAP